MKKKDGDYTRVNAKRVTSVIIVWLLVISGILVVFPIIQPTVEAEKYHYGGSAAWEDSDLWDGIPGGLDYNGDPANDGKITWHAGIDSPHIVNVSFIVNDGYILEIQAGADVRMDLGIQLIVGQTSAATLYSNGTSGSTVNITQNVTGSAWGGIFIVEQSYGYMNCTMVDGGGVIYVDNAMLDMNNSGITNMDSPGIYATSSSISVMNSFIANASMAGIVCLDTDAVIDNNDIFGYNGTDGGSGGIDGGHAIYLTGSSSSCIISNNRLYGGNGGDDLSGGGGGGGGFGVFDSNYNGQLIIIDNELIQGGNGGNNTGVGMDAGDGGMGIHIIPISDLDILGIINNTDILGGRGGDNNAIAEGHAGDGGRALWIADNPPGSAGDALVSLNTNIIGGNGGHNNAVWDGSFGGWTAGNGGDGLFIMDSKMPCNILIEENPNILGGNGGGNTGPGGPVLPMPKAGDGGNGILLWNSTEVIISECSSIGGHGGNNTVTGNLAIAGDGGNGLLLYYPTPDFLSFADISASTLTGGEGGDDWVGGAGLQGGAGRGGSGLYSTRGTGTCIDSDLFGGKGGDNYGPDGGGGSGGSGAGISDSFDLMITQENIVGGKGGGNYEMNGRGGSGGSAVYISGSDNITLNAQGNIIGGKGGENFELSGIGGSGGSAFSIYDSNNIDLNDILNLVGGDGGDADFGLWPGPAAPNTLFTTTSTNVNIIGNNITVGIGGYNSSSDTYGPNGSTCIMGENLGGLNTIIGNDLTTNNRGGGTNGIYLDPSVVVIADNDIYKNDYGISILDSNDVTIGDNNRIFNNTGGIYLSSSDANVGTGNTISNNDFGIISENSNPTIAGDQVINSSQIGLFFSDDSNATVEGCSVINSGMFSVYCQAGSGGGSSPKFYNSTLTTISGTGDFLIDEDSHPWTLNTTFDKDGTIFFDNLSNLTVNWYMHVRVVNVSNDPVNNADIWVNDTYDNNIFYGQTPADGWIRWIVVTEYVENQTGSKFYYTPHNASANEGGRFGFEIENMDMSKEIIIVLGGIKFSIPLKEGWNMISIPLNMSNTTLTNVLSDIDGNYISVWGFNISDIADTWKLYNVDKPVVDLSNIERRTGIWILMRSDDTLTVGGTEPDPSITDIHLKAGWNFVGYPSITTRIAGINPGDAFYSISAFVDTVQYYNASDLLDPWKAWDIGSYTSDDLTEIKFGYGLWIYVTGDCTWSVDW